VGRANKHYSEAAGVFGECERANNTSGCESSRKEAQRMTKTVNGLLGIILICLPAWGQSAFSGSSQSTGGLVLASGSGCSAPNFCSYSGVDVVPWGTVPNLSSSTNGVQNNATVYDTSFLGHYNLDGVTTFTNSINLSPVTRVTDATSAAGSTRPNFTAGIGGSAAFVLTGLSLTGGGWIRVDQSTAGRVCWFNSAAYPGHCQPYSAYANSGSQNPGSGVFLTTNMCNPASGCFSGSSAQAQDFGQVSFSLTDPNTLFTFGGNAYDITAGTPAATGVTPYTISRANGSVGVYSMGPSIVDFQYGIPAGSNAPAWQQSTSYAYGAYVTHPLTSSEMLNGGNWGNALTVNAGDIIQSGSCMYRAVVGGVTASTGGSPTFLTSNCKNDYIPSASTFDGTVRWRGTNSAPQFIYQDVTAGTHTSRSAAFQWIATPAILTAIGSISSGSAVLSAASGSPFATSQVGQAVSVSGAGSSGGILYTTILSFTSATSVTLAVTASTTVTASATVSLTGHPDFLSSTSGDTNGLVWVNVGPSYLPQSGNQIWSAIGGTSRDNSYPAASWPRYYSVGASTNTYGAASGTTASGATGYNKYNNDQGSGAWVIEYDAVTNIYHLLNTATGIWTDFSCSGGTGYNCAGGSRTQATIGSLNAITNPLGTGQPCPFYVHNAKMSKNGLYILITMQAQYYPTCNSLSNFYLWKTTDAGYSSSSTSGSLQITYAGMNHWDIGTNKLVAFNGSGFTLGTCSAPCYTTGVFTTVYDLTGNVSAAGSLSFGTALNAYYNAAPRLANAGLPQSIPQGCYVTSGSPAVQQNPDCNLSEVLDSHLSLAGDNGSDTYPACGTSYNYATLGPATNAFQNMETCYSTYPSYAASSLPEIQGTVWQFTHTFATGTSATFSTQFQISEYSQDANWLFWSSDWNCQNGSTNGISPTVWSAGTYVDVLAVTPVPANASSICGLPWAANTTYVVGNMIDPIEGTSGSGAVDDVFQAIYVGGPTGAAQPGPALPHSYFSTSTSPTATSAGSTICDASSGASMNPSLPYSASCAAGTVWQDVGPQNQRGDVFAVNLGHN
jgi:hypothetical protein